MTYWPKLCAELMLENLQLRGALGQSVPSWVPEPTIQCGLCAARREGYGYATNRPPDFPVPQSSPEAVREVAGGERAPQPAPLAADEWPKMPSFLERSRP